jgi:hypothetical protein
MILSKASLKLGIDAIIKPTVSAMAVGGAMPHAAYPFCFPCLMLHVTPQSLIILIHSRAARLIHALFLDHKSSNPFVSYPSPLTFHSRVTVT